MWDGMARFVDWPLEVALPLRGAMNLRIILLSLASQGAHLCHP
jgi:hypothetical protein